MRPASVAKHQKTQPEAALISAQCYQRNVMHDRIGIFLALQKWALAIVMLLSFPDVYAGNPQLAILFESDWQWYLSHAPEYATQSGDNRYNHRLSNTSLAASRVAYQHQLDMLREIKKIRRDELLGQDLISYDEFLLKKEQLVQLATLYPAMVQPISHMDGFQLAFPRLVAQTPFVTAIDYHNYLSRLHALPVYVDGIIEQLNAGIKAGWVAPKVIISPVPAQLRALRMTLETGVLGQPFRNIPSSLPRPEVFAQRGSRELVDHVAPALQKLENYIVSTYLPACRDSIAASSLPGGMPYYDYLVKTATTTTMTAQEIHALGVSEVARIKLEMQQVMKDAGFHGTMADYIRYLTTDKRFFYTSPDALLEEYRNLIHRANLALPGLFSLMPKATVDVQAMPLPGAEQQPLAYYSPAPDDGSRSGYFVVNVTLLSTRAKWKMETLALHETIPGHHLQISLAQESTDLPAFRRHGWNDAFGEGWALYAESLGGEMGFYTDPASKFGNLNEELLRSARLVVDTGIHALGWTREQAIAYLNDNTANSESENAVEVDRYIAWPGQALGYKIGQLAIAGLRKRATDALGKKFDIRAFHQAVLENGALPLPLLEDHIDHWIKQQKEAH